MTKRLDDATECLRDRPKEIDRLAKFGKKISYETDNIPAQVGKNWNNLRKLDCTDFIEGYKNSGVNFCLKGRIEGVQPEPSDFLLFVSRHADQLSEHIGLGENNADVKLKGTNNPYLVAHSSCCCDHQEQAVFVDDIKVVQDGEVMVVRDGLIIRLFLFDKFEGTVGYPLYVSTLNGIFEFLPFGTDRKLVVVEGALTILTGKRDYKVVEDRPELMHCFTCNDAKPRVNGDVSSYLHDICRSIWIEVSPNKVLAGIRRQDRSDFTIKICDVFVGPLNLGGNSL